ncbi:MAG: transcriptional regulator [Desulfovibrionaceae bacterium]|nr:transcriptional regulator [Desulfovibrionaceae bacterium]
MGATELSAAISAVEPLIKSLIALGLPGIILILAAIPTLAIVAVFAMNSRQTRRMERMLEAYRADTQKILADMGQKHEEVADFYRKNVSLVKNYERMADVLQTVVVNNTRAMEHLSTIIETRNGK